MMSVAGTFYGQYVLVLDPERLFSMEISIIVLLMTVLGGSGTLWGPVLGLFALSVLRNGLHLAALPSELTGVLTGTVTNMMTAAQWACAATNASSGCTISSMRAV